jgi:hypothetical protein
VAVETLVREPPVRVPANATVGEAARAMRDRHASAVLVDSLPPGIVTDRDFRNKVLAEGLGPGTPVTAIASSPLKTVPGRTAVNKAWQTLLDQGVHHLPITRGEEVIGVLTAGDLLKTTAQGPPAMLRSVERLVAPAPMIAALARAARLIGTAQAGLRCSNRPCVGDATNADAPTGDLAVSLETARRRANAALLAAAGVLVEATAPRELIAVGDTMPVTVSVYNQGPVPVRLVSADVSTAVSLESEVTGDVAIAPDSSGHLEVPLHPEPEIDISIEPISLTEIPAVVLDQATA